MTKIVVIVAAVAVFLIPPFMLAWAFGWFDEENRR